MTFQKMRIFLTLVAMLQFGFIPAQENHLKGPEFLADGFIGVNIGYINYPFGNQHMEAGYKAETIQIPRPAVRIILFGYRFNKSLSMQVSYMRPVNWVIYRNVNGDQSYHTVWMNVAGLTFKSRFPLKEKFSMYTEAGLGIITRNGFYINQAPVVGDANYATLLGGAGVQYHLSHKWDLLANMVWSPANEKSKQPATVFYSTGFTYYMRPSVKDKVVSNPHAEYIFPRNMLQVGYTTNGLGYGVNNTVSDMSIFWGGEVEIAQGLSLFYKRNVYHTRKTFSFDWGAAVSYWKSRKQEEGIFTVALFPVFRITPVHLKNADLYFNYSVAGPAFISKPVIDNRETGKQFTFFDFMGAGAFLGKERKLNAEIKIMHFSNGNLFPVNAGLKIPLTFTAGYTF